LRPANVATFVASGLDVNFNYRFTIDGIGNFNARVVGGYLNNLTFVNTPGAEPDEDVDEPRSPQFVGTLDLTWTSGPLTVNYGLAWQSETRRFTTEQLRGNPDLSDPIYFFYKERWEHDIQVALNVADRFTFYMGVNNFTDQKPDVASAGQFPISPVGRYFYAGARVSLDRIGDLLGR
jgi:outer membrane receptor protein involved in Fe transport